MNGAATITSTVWLARNVRLPFMVLALSTFIVLLRLRLIVLDLNGQRLPVHLSVTVALSGRLRTRSWVSVSREFLTFHLHGIADVIVRGFGGGGGGGGGGFTGGT